MKKTVKKINEAIQSIVTTISNKQATAAARTFKKYEKAHKKATDELKKKMQTELEEIEKSKSLIKEYGKQEGDKLFEDKSTVEIINGVQLIRSAQQPDYNLTKLTDQELRELLFNNPEAVKLNASKVAEKYYPLLAKTIDKDQPQAYTYTVKLASEKKAVKKGVK